MKLNIEHNRLSAFTLLEITITMLLVAVLSGFAYYAFQTFMNISYQEQTEKRDQYMLELFLSRIENDWNLADSIAYTEDELLFQDSIGDIYYMLQDSLILRQQYDLRIDSFFLDMDITAIQYLEKADFQSPLVNHLTGNIYFKGGAIPLNLNKIYSASQIIHSSKENYDGTD